VPKKTAKILWKFTKAGTFEYSCLIPDSLVIAVKDRDNKTVANFDDVSISGSSPVILTHARPMKSRRVELLFSSLAFRFLF